MRDVDRLDLLKEVAGTTVYEERRAESLKILQDTATKQERIAEILDFIEQRLHELEEEKDELKEYEELDRRRRALEYNMYDKELGKAVASLQRMEQEQEGKRARQHELYASLRAAEELLLRSEEELVALRAASERTAGRRDAKAAELADAVTMRSRCEVSLQAAEQLRSAQESEAQSLRAELEALSVSIGEGEAALGDIQRLYESKGSELGAARERRAANQMRIDTLYGKQGRGRQFATAKERDAFLKTQISQLESQISENSALAASLSAEVQAQQAELARTAEALKAQEGQNRQRVAAIDASSKDIEQKLIQRNTMQERRKQLWRDLESVQEQLADSRSEQSKGRQMLSTSLPRAVTMGLAAVEGIAAELKLKGYYGPLIDNFTLKNDIFRTSVEVAAGNALFHVVVDNERTAATLMEELERRRAGRLTFLPLNRLQNDRVQYPNSPDVKPLLEVAIDYDAAMEPALQHVSIAMQMLLRYRYRSASHFNDINASFIL
jgi:structural maintenance of chromosome 3 (chondroitin sulfate proteoglycan 6)